MQATRIVRPRTHWSNAWFLRLLARVVVCVDGVDYAARWGRPAERIFVDARSDFFYHQPFAVTVNSQA